MDWKRTILSRFLSGPALLVAQLQADPTFRSEAERVIVVREGGGGSRATYFNYAKKLHLPDRRYRLTEKAMGHAYDWRRLHRRVGRAKQS